MHLCLIKHLSLSLSLERVHLDILGPFPERLRGNSYALMVVNQLTKWLECYPLAIRTAMTVAQSLVDNFISRFSRTVIIHTDQGRQFDGELFNAVCKLLQTVKTRTTPVYPASNGQVERYNRTILSLIRVILKMTIGGMNRSHFSLGRSDPWSIAILGSR